MDNTLGRQREGRPSSGASRLARLDIEKSLSRQRLHRSDPLASRRLDPLPESAPTGEGLFAIELHTLIDHLRRHALLILLTGLAGVGAALLYGVIATPKFTVATEILVDPASLQVVSDDLYSRSEQRDALLLNVESKMRILVSTNVLNQVIAGLDLQTDREFVPGPSWLPSFGSGPSAPPEILALRALSERVKVSRDERSFVVTLAVTSEDPAKSVSIAERIVSAFQAELARADAEGAGRTAASLVDRLAELKTEVTLAEQAVEAFRRDNNLQTSQGELVSTQSLTQLNTQVNDAQRRLIEAQSRYDDLTVGGAESVLSAAAQESATLSALRTQYATLRQQADSLSLSLGPRHPNLQAILPQVQAIEREIAAETARIVEAAKSDVAQAEAVLLSLDRQTETAQSVVVADNSAEVELRDLQRDASAQAAIYEAFLTRAREVTERESIDTTNIRVISEPALPTERSWPPRLVQLAGLGAAAGIALGALIALARGLTRARPRLNNQLPPPLTAPLRR